MASPTLKANHKEKIITNDSRKITPLNTGPTPKSQIEAEEEVYIAFLEAKLGYSRRGKREKKSEDDDGLSGECADTLFAE
jgi:hypothetical protein